ncbi:hypothetical protein BO94DRAFT_625411 [Aspergillus sclerotioniger CBS 115572]|uniref:Uncharacterized protein n=1 Tax=Aspergillus sclerotioniger CBS 115572 TaxID=1450535 RepID=A0A317WFQ6_9EURO|nr:hypothetical protein BO94DRAFT_625411 [Aspergillus sclerotioniger CBS 115572]PWY83848.1 hypothetical protein BO94DRAFT_625411 [Aspergillus sclerotioniger CBS 115572]
MHLHLATLLTTTFITFLTLTKAIRITTPKTGDIIHCNQPWQVCWEAVNTDPPQFCLYLTNFIDFPPQIFPLLGQRPIVTDGGGCVTIPPPSCPSPLRNTPYRVRATVCGDPNTIFAESGDFRVVL